MDINQNARPSDRNNAPAGRTLSGFSGDRLTVQSMERQAQQSRRHRRRRRSRSRSSHTEESRAGRNVWIAVLIVAFLYIGFLVLSRYVSKSNPAKSASGGGKKTEAAAKTVTPAKPAPAPVPGGTSSGNAAQMIANIDKAYALSEDAKKLMRVRQPMAAEVKLREALALAPDSISLLTQLAEAYVEQGKWSDARPVLYRALAIAPESVPARLSLARVSFELGEYDDAMALANWIIESEPYSEAAHEIAAGIATRLEQYDVAVTHWQKLVSLNSNNHVAENNLGLAYMKLGQSAQALKSFENVLRDEPANSQAYYYMALGFIQKKEPELAVSTLSRAIERFGYAFVYAWSRGTEFDSLKELPSFKKLFDREPSTAATAAPPG